MQKRGLYKNKKAITEGLWTVIGIIFAGVLILLSGYILFKFTGLIRTPPAEESAAINNFNVLTQKTQELVDASGQFASTTMPYNLPQGYAVIGFDEDTNTFIFDKWIGADTVDKPTQCGNKACLCLYGFETGLKNLASGENKDKDIIGCHIFQSYQNIIFSTDLSLNTNLKGIKRTDIPSYYPNTEYAHLFWFFELLGSFYIEKYTDRQTGNIYIFITEKTDTITQREEYMKNTYAS